MCVCFAVLSQQLSMQPPIEGSGSGYVYVCASVCVCVCVLILAPYTTPFEDTGSVYIIPA